MRAIVFAAALFAIAGPARADLTQEVDAMARYTRAQAEACLKDRVEKTAPGENPQRAAYICLSENIIVQDAEADPFDDRLEFAASLTGRDLDGQPDRDAMIMISCEQGQTVFGVSQHNGANSVRSNVRYRIGRDKAIEAQWPANGPYLMLIGADAVRLLRTLSARPDDL